MKHKYLGRIVAIAMTPSARPAVLYRVSSRSFPNRDAVLLAPDKAAIIPKKGCENDIHRNPYIAYNCARIVRDFAILSNGSHTDPIAEKIATGMSARDALALSLLAMDYEKDHLNTPRIAAVASFNTNTAWLASVRANGLDVREFLLHPGSIIHLSTYEHEIPTAEYMSEFKASSKEEACDFILHRGIFENFTNPVTSVAAVAESDGWSLAIQNI